MTVPAAAEVCFSASWGGLEHYCAEVTQRLTAAGHRVVPVFRPGTPLSQRVRDGGMEPYEFKARDYFDPVTALRLARVFRREKITAVHVHRTQDLAVALTAADWAGVGRRVLTLQMESRRRKRDLFHRWVYGRLTRVLTITERMRRLVLENVAVAPSKVRTLYYGVDVAGLRAGALPQPEIRRRWGLQPEAFVVGMVGRLEPGKGQEVLIRAAAKVAGSAPEVAVMVVGDETVGRPGERARLERLAGELLPGRVVFTGYQHPPGAVVPAFDVSVLASAKETFGLVVIEAMALGVPVVASNAGGVPEIIRDGSNGLLVPPGDAESLAAALERLRRSPELRADLAAEGFRTVQERFSLHSHLAELVGELTGA